MAQRPTFSENGARHSGRSIGIVTVPGSLYDVFTRIPRQVSRAKLELLRASPVFFDQFYDDRYRVGLVAF